MRTAESPAACNLAFEMPLHLIKGAQEFGGSFALSVHARRVQRIRCSCIVFGDMCEIGRLFSIDCARACQKEFSCPMGNRKRQRALCARDDSREHLKWGSGSLLRTGLGRRVDHILIFSFGKSKAANVTVKERNRGIGCQVWAFSGECLRVAGQDRSVSIQPMKMIDMAEALDQPAAEKTSPAGDEQPLAPEFIPKPLSIGDNEFKVESQPVHGMVYAASGMQSELFTHCRPDPFSTSRPR